MSFNIVLQHNKIANQAKFRRPDKLVDIDGIPITVHSAGVYPQGS